MLPIGPLMIEHRLIERMITLLGREALRMERDQSADLSFLDTAIDFIQVYADRLHHGKEDEILFRALDGKPLSAEHQRILAELREEHRTARRVTAVLRDAAGQCRAGNKQALQTIIDQAAFLAESYPRHIEKEDRRFFIPCMQYFTPAEKDDLLNREYEADRNLIHALYKEKVQQAESKKTAA